MRAKAKFMERVITEAEKELKKGKLTLGEYNAIMYLLPELWHGKAVEIVQEQVATFFRFHYCEVTPKGVGWIAKWDI